MRIAVTGRAGQVAQALIERGRMEGHDVVPIGREAIDLAQTGTSAMAAALRAAAPQVLVSAAAYTAVDKAEAEPDLAMAVNAAGPGRLAQAAAELRVPVIHLSTDYVFDGSGSRPWREGDPTGPKGVYGAGKLAGELAVAAAQSDSAILRTAWVYSPWGANFVKTMLRLAESREEVGVVADQVGNPTSALAIADGVIAVAANLLADPAPALRGVFHMAGSGEASWADLAEAVFAASAARGGPSATVRRIATADYPTPARRPANSRLDCRRIEAVHDVRLAPWQDSLEAVIDRLVGGKDIAK